MDEGLRQIVAVLAVAMIVALVARRLRLPYTVGLVIVGAGVAAFHRDFGLRLTYEAIFDLILPPLLFEAALSIHWRELRRDLAPILALATLGTLVAAGAATFGMMLLLGWPLPSAIVFGSLIAATDPVAIIAMFKDNDLKGRLRLLVETESLLNDGAAAVLFVMALGFAQHSGEFESARDVGFALLRIVFGGIAIGALSAGAAIALAWRSDEHMVEAALTTIAAYGSFLLAEYFHDSGVLATVTAGLLLGNLGVLRDGDAGFFSPKGREFVIEFWEFAAFFANSAVFLLIGVNVAVMPFEARLLPALGVAVIVALVGRALTVYPIGMLFDATRWRLSSGEMHVLWWGGLRGALALALALSLPESLPLRDEILFVTFGVVAFSIVIQGLTMPALLRRLRFLTK